MLVSINRWLEPPSFEGDEEKTIQTRIANTLVLYLGAALLIVIFILIPLFAFQKIGSWICGQLQVDPSRQAGGNARLPSCAFGNGRQRPATHSGYDF